MSCTAYFDAGLRVQYVGQVYGTHLSSNGSLTRKITRPNTCHKIQKLAMATAVLLLTAYREEIEGPGR